MQTTHRDDSVIYVLAQDYNGSVYILSNDSLNCVNELCQLSLNSEAIPLTKVGRYFCLKCNVNPVCINHAAYRTRLPVMCEYYPALQCLINVGIAL